MNENNESGYATDKEKSQNEIDLENDLLRSEESGEDEEPDSKKPKNSEEPTKEVKQVKTVRELRAERQQSNQTGLPGNDESEAKHIELIHTSEKPAFQTLKCTFSTCSRTFKSWNQLCKHTRSWHYVVGKKCDFCPIYLETDDDKALHIGRLFFTYF